MAPGDRWVYRETGEGEPELRVEVTVTDKTKTIANGIEARVVHDVVTKNGQLVEVTDDWYAQDRAGNVWYLGEDTAEYENGKVTTRSGSFEAGVDGAQPGIIMPADPQVGQSYRQEYYAGEAEDAGAVLSLDAQAEVPFGHVGPALMTQDTNPLEPKVYELKFYARDSARSWQSPCPAGATARSCSPTRRASSPPGGGGAGLLDRDRELALDVGAEEVVDRISSPLERVGSLNRYPQLAGVEQPPETLHARRIGRPHHVEAIGASAGGVDG
jgi:hypothetical protein